MFFKDGSPWQDSVLASVDGALLWPWMKSQEQLNHQKYSQYSGPGLKWTSPGVSTDQPPTCQSCFEPHSHCTVVAMETNIITGFVDLLDPSVFGPTSCQLSVDQVSNRLTVVEVRVWLVFVVNNCD